MKITTLDHCLLVNNTCNYKCEYIKIGSLPKQTLLHKSGRVQVLLITDMMLYLTNYHFHGLRSLQHSHIWFYSHHQTNRRRSSQWVSEGLIDFNEKWPLKGPRRIIIGPPLTLIKRSSQSPTRWEISVFYGLTLDQKINLLTTKKSINVKKRRNFSIWVFWSNSDNVLLGWALVC